MIRDILVYPDKRLKQVSKDVEKFDESLHLLLDDMYETMVAKDGIGLAAIQIGVAKNVLIINIPEDEKEQEHSKTIEAINPKIIKHKGEETHQEGCLSVPGVYEDISRYADITVEYQDRYGNTIIKECNSLLSVAFQHEMDHLEGKLFVEKLSYLKRKKFEKEWKKKLKAQK